MKIDYITDDSKRVLSPFFSVGMISTQIMSIVLIAVILIFSVPRKELSYYIQEQSRPFTFLVVFAGAILLISYLSLKVGRGEIAHDARITIRNMTGISTYEEERAFFSYGFIESLLHTGMLLYPIIPLLIIGAGFSGIKASMFAVGLLIIYFTSLSCRLFGFIIYLFYGKKGFKGFILSRSFFLLYIFGTWTLGARFNPLLLMYLIHEGDEKTFGFIQGHWLVYVSGSIFLAVVFSSIIEIIIMHRKQRGRLAK